MHQAEGRWGVMAKQHIQCDYCGRFIGYKDIVSGAAISVMLTPDSAVSYETWKTLCPVHAAAERLRGGNVDG